MYSESRGTQLRNAQSTYPQDIVLYGTVPAWEIHLSGKEKELLLHTTDYHPGLLHLSIDDMIDIIQRLDSSLKVIKRIENTVLKKEQNQNKTCMAKAG